ncbi:hypothetical protein LTR56_023814 [Elasticomyces elasticus]|nr:hypothetical protein LTR56_023814 [Elasticomyces elasticus]KAK3663889.1 hypothetical protein LTR22_005350 [Elasticomyces elasticus]KAK4906517.1 hypothetical protein LTR49_024363 [Elasticomyces elasticus]KAK5745421.1 hypothetical protein LTS12_023141 [Elasticomyces elasticus]
MALSEIDTGPFKVTPSIYYHLEQGLARSPDKPAVIAMHQAPSHLGELLGGCPNGAGACLSWSYTQLHHAALRVAVGLMRIGIETGETVVTFMPNSVEYAIMLWASAMVRLTLACLDPGALSAARGPELESLLRRLNPAVIYVPSVGGAAVVDEALLDSGIQPPRVKICHDAKQVTGWLTFEQLATNGGEREVDTEEVLEAARHDEPSRVCIINFTSGTSSGIPKGCPRHVAAMSHVFENNPWDMKDVRGKPVRFVLSTTNFRVIAPQFTCAAWKAGGTVIMIPPSPSGGFNTTGTLDAIEKHGATTLLLIPVMLHLLLAEPSFTTRNLNSLGAVMVGADIIDRATFTKAHNAFNHCRVSCAHGMTESGGTVTWPFFDKPLDMIPYVRDIYPIGKLVPGVAARIWDHETKRTTTRGEPGELCFSAESVIKRYLDNVSPESFFLEDEKQWFRTGDFSVMDADDVIFIVGRIKDVVKRAGIPIVPAALESCIKAYTDEETCVVATPHPQLGQEPFAILKARSSKSEEEIKTHVVTMFGRDYSLAGVASLEDLSLQDFPLNSTAKILKFELQQRLEEFRKIRRIES